MLRLLLAVKLLKWDIEGVPSRRRVVLEFRFIFVELHKMDNGCDHRAGPFGPAECRLSNRAYRRRRINNRLPAKPITTADVGSGTACASVVIVSVYS